MTSLGRTLRLVRQSWRIEGIAVSSTAVWLAIIFALGLTLRLVWVVYTTTVPLGGDPHWYYIVAINVAKGYGFVSNSSPSLLGESIGPGEPTAFWPPAYPIVLAGFWKLFGISLMSAKVLNAVLGALAIPFVYLLGRQIFDRRVGVVAAGLFAVYPNVIAWTPLLFSEQLFILLFVAALWLLAVVPSTSRHRWALVGFGFLTGVAILTRGQAAVLIPVAVVFWLMRSGWQPTVRWTALSLLVAAIVITPWTVRNWVELDAFVPVSTNTGAALRVGHNTDSTGTTKWTNEQIDGFAMWQSPYRPDWEVQGYREYTRRAIDYAFTNPGHELELTGLKIYHLYRADSDVIPWLTTLGTTPLKPRGMEEALERLIDYTYYPLLFAAAASVSLWLRRDAYRALLVSVAFFWTLFHIVFLGEPRYHLPLIPVFCIAVVGGASVARGRLDALRERWWPRSAVSADQRPAY